MNKTYQIPDIGRILSGVNKSELADELGLSRAAFWQRLNRGYYEAAMTEIYMLADALGLTLSQIFGEGPVDEGPNDNGVTISIDSCQPLRLTTQYPAQVIVNGQDVLSPDIEEANHAELMNVGNDRGYDHYGIVEPDTIIEPLDDSIKLPF